jgi:hypothetical protein
VTHPTSGSAAGIDRTDLALAVGLLAFIGLFAWRTFDPSMAPSEDAAMLMRYSQNFAAGHGITWNAGEAPVDGATDFLFMLSVGLLAKTGITIEHATQFIGLGAHIFTCLFVFFAIRRLHPSMRWTAWLSAAYLAIGPGLRYVEAYFGTPYFAMFSATTWYFAYRVFRGADSRAVCTWFALSSLALERHDGCDSRVMIGGLGLGYTAHEVLDSDAVASVDVVEFLPQVIGWMKNGLVPLSDELNSEPRFSVVEGDVYSILAAPPEQRYDLILIDVDHSPDETLADANAFFYTEAGLEAAKRHLKPSGLLGVWSYADSGQFVTALRAVFPDAEIEPCAFDNAFTGTHETNWLFLALND